MTFPFRPISDSLLPANRFVLYADADHVVRQIDETRLDREGQTMLNFWDSSSLNGGQGEDREFTLRRLWFAYSSLADTDLAVRASGDGGVTWELPVTFGVLETDIGVKRVATGFNTSGFDLRFRLIFPTDELVIVHEYSARLVPRSEYIIGP